MTVSESINERIRKAVTPIVPVCVPDFYKGDAAEYCTFNYEEIPGGHGGNGPTVIRYLIQLHYFLPPGRSPVRKKRELARAILAAGFTYPEIHNASDGEDQHWAFEFEGLDREG